MARIDSRTHALAQTPAPTGDTRAIPQTFGEMLDARMMTAPLMWIPVPRALEGRVKRFPDIPRPMREDWAKLPDAARARLQQAVDADPLTAFADVAPAELADVALDSYASRLDAISRELERAVDATHTNAKLTKAERLADVLKLEDRAAAGAAELRAARDAVLGNLETSAQATLDAYAASFWSMPPIAEQVARERWREASEQGIGAVRDLLSAAATLIKDEGVKLALLRIAKAAAVAKSQDLKPSGDVRADVQAAATSFRDFAPLVATFEDAIRPVAVGQAHDTMRAVRRVRTEIGLLDQMAYKRVERAPAA